MICVIKSGPHKDLMNSDFPCPWYHLLFQMSSFPQILTLFWTCVFIPSPEWFILVFLTLNLTPLPILKNVHYFHRQSPLQHFTFHWGSFSVARKAHITLLNTDRIKQHGTMCGGRAKVRDWSQHSARRAESCPRGEELGVLAGPLEGADLLSNAVPRDAAFAGTLEPPRTWEQWKGTCTVKGTNLSVELCSEGLTQHC